MSHLVSRREMARKSFVYAALLLWSFICLFPLYWLALTSIKGEEALDRAATYLPFLDFAPTLDAWRFILADPYENLDLRFFNSLVVGIVSTALTLTLAAMAIYGFTRLRRSARKSRFTPGPATAMALMMTTRILPPIVAVIPLYVMAEAARLRDTLLLLILLYTAANLPVAVWLLQPVIGSSASEQEEAALIDGASHPAILFGIVLPMARGGVIAAGVLVFLLCWNEYLFAALLTSTHAETLTPWMVGQLSIKEAQVGGGPEELAHLSAATVLMAAPALALTVFARRALERAFGGQRSF